MPIHTGQDKNGKFYQWGKTGKKYYFKPEDKQSKQRALNKVKKQQTAIYSSGWKRDTMKLIKVKCKDGLTKEQYEQKYKEFEKVFSSSRFLGGCTGWGGDFAEFENSDINPFVELLKDGSIQVEYWGKKDRIKKKFASNVSCRQVANFLKNEEKNFEGFE